MLPSENTTRLIEIYTFWKSYRAYIGGTSSIPSARLQFQLLGFGYRNEVGYKKVEFKYDMGWDRDLVWYLTWNLVWDLIWDLVPD